MGRNLDKMFRYLETYVGKYRVLAPYDIVTEDFPRNEEGGIDESFDDLYIPCSKGEIRASYYSDSDSSDCVLVWYTESAQQGRNIYKELRVKYPKIWLKEDDCDSNDYFIYFNAENINKIATIVKPRTSGAKIKPYSEKNLPKPLYQIPEADEASFNEIIKDLGKTERMHFVRKCCAEFDTVIQKKKGKKFDIAKERRETRLKPKAFISYLGLWDEFLKFTKKYYKEYKA